MSGGFPTPAGEGLGPIIRELERIQDRLSTLENPTGTSLNSLVAQVQEAIAQIGTTINAWLEANSYTAAEIDNKVANPGNISPGNVDASGFVHADGDLTSDGALRAMSVYSTTLSTDYRAVWVTGTDGQLGFVPSSIHYKQDITPSDMDATVLIMAAEIVWFRYRQAVADNDDAQFVLGGIAQQFAAAGLVHTVTNDEYDEPFSIEDRPLLYTLIQSHQELVRRVELLEAPLQN